MFHGNDEHEESERIPASIYLKEFIFVFQWAASVHMILLMLFSRIALYLRTWILFNSEYSLINSTSEEESYAIKNDAELTQVLHTAKPCADTIGHFRTKTSLIFQIDNLRTDLNAVRYVSSQSCQWKHITE